MLATLHYLTGSEKPILLKIHSDLMEEMLYLVNQMIRHVSALIEEPNRRIKKPHYSYKQEWIGNKFLNRMILWWISIFDKLYTHIRDDIYFMTFTTYN